MNSQFEYVWAWFMIYHLIFECRACSLVSFSEVMKEHFSLFLKLTIVHFVLT